MLAEVRLGSAGEEVIDKFKEFSTELDISVTEDPFVVYTTNSHQSLHVNDIFS